MKFRSVLTVFPFPPCFVITVPVFVDKAPKSEGSCKSWIYIYLITVIKSGQLHSTDFLILVKCSRKGGMSI